MVPDDSCCASARRAFTRWVLGEFGECERGKGSYSDPVQKLPGRVARPACPGNSCASIKRVSKDLSSTA